MDTTSLPRRHGPGAVVDALATRVIGAAIAVHRALGPGYLEAVYVAALLIELRNAGLRVETEKKFAVHYRGYPVGYGRLDVLVEDLLIVELKTVEAIVPIHIAQALSYLAATGLPLALVINFKTSCLRDGIRRVVRT